MQSSLKLPRFKSDRLLTKRKSNLTKGLTLAILLPQALIFVAASEVEHKAQFYLAVVIGTVAAALAIAFLSTSFKSGCEVIPALTKLKPKVTLLHDSQD